MSDADRTRRALLANVSDIDTILIPPGTQYGATWGKSQKGKAFGYAVFATPCTPLQHLMDHS